MKHAIAIAFLFAAGSVLAGDGLCWKEGKPQPWEGYNRVVAWAPSLAEAQAKAADEGRMILFFQLVGDLDKGGCWAAGDIMRTVTFSDERVGKELAKDFVCAWTNRKDSFHNCDTSTENWIFQNSGDVYPTRNIVTYVLTPDLQVLHYFSGYFSPALFIRQIQFARRLRMKIFDEFFVPAPRAAEAFRQMHLEAADETREWAKRLGRYGDDEWDEIQKEIGTFSYGKKTHVHGKACLQLVRDVHTYIALVHDDLGGAEANLTKVAWLSQSVQVGRYAQRVKPEGDEKRSLEGLPLLSETRGKFLYGNAFAEE